MTHLDLKQGSLPDLLRAIVKHFHADSGTLHLLEDGMLRLCAIEGAMPPPLVEIISVIPIGKGMAGLAAERKEPVTACNIQTDTSGDVRPGAKATGMEGAIVVPMLGVDGTLCGTLGVAQRAARDWTSDETAELLTYGQMIAERARSNRLA